MSLYCDFIEWLLESNSSTLHKWQRKMLKDKYAQPKISQAQNPEVLKWTQESSKEQATFQLQIRSSK